MDPEAARLHARLTSVQRRFSVAREMVAQHLDGHAGHVAWSGGKDSTVVAHMAADMGAPVVTYVAGTEYPEVLPYCQALSDEHGWRWEPIQTADVTELLDRGVLPGSDGEWWEAMIAGPARIAHQRHGDGLLWGLRAEESSARSVMLYATRGVRTRRDGVTTCAPLWRWSTADVYGYLAAHDLPLCPTYARMAQVGMPIEMRRVGRIVGRRNMPSRLMWLQRGWPDVWATYIGRWPWLRESA